MYFTKFRRQSNAHGRQRTHVSHAKPPEEAWSTPTTGAWRRTSQSGRRGYESLQLICKCNHSISLKDGNFNFIRAEISIGQLNQLNSQVN